MMLWRLAICVLGQTLLCGVVGAENSLSFVNTGQSLENNCSSSVAVGDLDGDGDLDAMVANSCQDPKHTVWTNDGNGIFTNTQELEGIRSYSVALGDLDGDGDLDAIFTSSESVQSTVWINDGNGTFTNSGIIIRSGLSFSVALGDLDGDGDLDAVFANFSLPDGLPPNTVFTNDGNGNFTNTGQALGSPAVSTSVALGDLDGDGDLDAMFANGDQPNTVWTNDGNGTFTDSGQSLGNSASTSVALGDLDGDGDLDAMFVNGNFNKKNQSNTVWTNDGNGNFTNTGQALGSLEASRSVALGDLDGDGDLDAMVANGKNQPNTVWTNDGSGTFTNAGQALGNRNSNSVALGDFDGNGNLDAIFANGSAPSPQPNTVWINQIICTGDINADGLVNAEDLTLLLAGWGESMNKADLNNDHVVDGQDLATILMAWGLPCDE